MVTTVPWQAVDCMAVFRSFSAPYSLSLVNPSFALLFLALFPLKSIFCPSLFTLY